MIVMSSQLLVGPFSVDSASAKWTTCLVIVHWLLIMYTDGFVVCSVCGGIIHIINNNRSQHPHHTG